MKDPKVAIATTTFYKDPLGKDAVRFNCAKRQVEKAVAAGYEIVVVDDSPTPIVAETLQALGAKVFRQQQPGMGASKRESAFHASFFGDIVVMNEAEKDDLVRHISALIGPVVTGAAEVVVAKRTPTSDTTYPPFQIETEKAADDAFELITGMTGIRPMFGPVGFMGDASRYFVLFNPARLGLPDTYIQHFGAVLSYFRGKMVSSIAVDFQYPPEQRAEESAMNDAIRAKRIQQRDSLIEAYRTLAGTQWHMAQVATREAHSFLYTMERAANRL